MAKFHAWNLKRAILRTSLPISISLSQSLMTLCDECCYLSSNFAATYSILLRVCSVLEFRAQLHGAPNNGWELFLCQTLRTYFMDVVYFNLTADMQNDAIIPSSRWRHWGSKTLSAQDHPPEKGQTPNMNTTWEFCRNMLCPLSGM